MFTSASFQSVRTGKRFINVIWFISLKIVILIIFKEKFDSHNFSKWCLLLTGLPFQSRKGDRNIVTNNDLNRKLHDIQ